MLISSRRDRTQEVQSLRLCQGHPNIVGVHEVYQDGVSPFELLHYWIVISMVDVRLMHLVWCMVWCIVWCMVLCMVWHMVWCMVYIWYGMGYGIVWYGVWYGVRYGIWYGVWYYMAYGMV